jgi:hypothetical protein
LADDLDFFQKLNNKENPGFHPGRGLRAGFSKNWGGSLTKQTPKGYGSFLVVDLSIDG